jgi:hypothetical protein
MHGKTPFLYFYGAQLVLAAKDDTFLASAWAIAQYGARIIIL